MQLDYLRKIAHDLKGPIGNTVMFSELIYENIEMLAEQNEERSGEIENLLYLTKNINRMNRRLVSQIDSWVDAQKLFEDEHDLHREVFQPARVINEIVEKNDIYIQKKDLELNVEVGEELNISGDQELIARTIDNLLANAIMFVDHGSEITISAELRDADDGEMIYIGVSDPFEGERSKVEARFTEPIRDLDHFEYGDGILKTTSFGMIFSNLAIEKMGGTTGVDHEGELTTFWFTVPAA